MVRLIFTATLAAVSTSTTMRGGHGHQRSLVWDQARDQARDQATATGWTDYFYGCRMGDIRYGSRWWNWWKPEGCTCWESKWEQNSQTGDAHYQGGSCDRTPNGLKVHDSYYDGGESGYYLVEVPAHLLAQEMLKEVMALPAADRPAYWQSRNVPENMRGLWWTDYNNGVTSFLHNQPAVTEQATGKLVTDTVVYGSNVWAWSTDTLYTLVDLLNLNYEFSFSDTDGSGQVDHAEIVPQFTRGNPASGLDVPTWLTRFTMGAASHCVNCRAYDAAGNPNAGTAGHTPVGEAAMTGAQRAAQACEDYTSAGGGTTPGSEQCWRRYTTSLTADASAPSQWDYDLIKIVDQWGQPIEPGFSNWVTSLRAEARASSGMGGSDKVLLARCMPGNTNCQGDNQPGVVHVQGGGLPWRP